MNFRKRVAPQLLGFQIAPMVDILLVLLVFFIVTWNFALSENELDVKVPSAANAKEQQAYVDQVVLNIRRDGTVTLNRKALTVDELKQKLSQLAQLYPNEAVILRADEQVPYRNVVDVLDVCRAANIWNVAFATTPTQPQ